MRYALLLLLLTACSPFTAEKITPPQLPETYLAAPSEKAIELQELWWESFADPRLNQLQQQLLSGNLDLRQALHRLEQLEALQRIKGASLWPSLNLSGTASRDRSTSASFTSLANSSRSSLAAGYEVDLWNRLHDQTTAAELRKQAGQFEIQTLLLSLTAQLTEQYFLAAEQRILLQLTQQQIKRNRQLVETITERYRAGLATTSELYLAQKNLAAIQARVPQFRTGLRQAENSLALLLGQLPQTQLTDTHQLPELSSLVAAGLPASLLTRRPDISAALLQVQAADRDLAAALADRLPAINLTATLGYTTTQLASGDLQGIFWGLAVGLTQPLFNGGRLLAESDRQQAVRAEQLAAYQQAILQAVQEVESALTADQNSAERVAWLQQQLQASEQELLLVRDNYRSGLNDSSSLLSSEISHLDVISQNVSAHRQWLSQRITLARALGGSWMAEELYRQKQTLNQKMDE